MKIVALIALAAALGACTQAAEDRPEPVRAVRVLKVGPAESVKRVEYAGEVRSRYETRLAFRVGGKIVERLVDVGSVVRPGQAVARLDAADLGLAAASARAQVTSAEAERTLAEAEFKRYRELRAKNFISQAELDRRANAFATAEARLAAARAQLRQAANQERYATLVADSGGIITAVEAEAGQVLSAGQTVARLAQPGEREIVFAVPEGQRDFIEDAIAFRVTLNAKPGRSWRARLRELSPAADPVTRTYAARVAIEGADGDVELGMSARVEVTRAAAAKRIEVPIAALHSRGQETQVFVLEQGHTVRAQPVKTAGVSGERVAIESGLAPGDVVVAAGAQLLRPGQRVRVLDEK